jgi:hypothetical protein
MADGHVRPAIDASDLLKLAHGIAVAAAGSVDTASHLLDLVTVGLQTPHAHNLVGPCDRLGRLH